MMYCYASASSGCFCYASGAVVITQYAFPYKRQEYYKSCYLKENVCCTTEVSKVLWHSMGELYKRFISQKPDVLQRVRLLHTLT